MSVRVNLSEKVLSVGEGVIRKPLVMVFYSTLEFWTDAGDHCSQTLAKALMNLSIRRRD